MSRKMLNGSDSSRPARPSEMAGGFLGRLLFQGKGLVPAGVVFEHHHLVQTLVFQQAGQFEVEPPAERTAVDNQGLVLVPRRLLQGELKHGKHQIKQDHRQVHGALDMFLLKKGAFPGIDENGLVLLVHLPGPGSGKSREWRSFRPNRK